MRVSFPPRGPVTTARWAGHHRHARRLAISLTVVIGGCNTHPNGPMHRCTMFAPPVSMTVAPTSVTIDPGQSVDLTITQDFNGQVCHETARPTVTPADPSVATTGAVPEGDDVTASRLTFTVTLRGVKGGTTQIDIMTAASSQVSRQATVAVTVNPAAIAISPSPVSVPQGGTRTVTASLTHSDGSTVSVPVTWTTGNSNVATVAGGSGESAVVTGVAVGSTQLTAKAGNTTATATVNVTGVMQLPAILTGRMLGWDDVTALPGIVVRVSGFPSLKTDAQGTYTLDVSPGGSLSVFGQGVCDPDHACSHERSFNSTESNPVTVASGETVVLDLHARQGYHLRITSGFQDRTVGINDDVPLTLGYEVWSRASLPGGAPRITAGVDGEPGDAVFVGVPGAYPPSAGTGTANLKVKAPDTPGMYGVYALLVTATASSSADSTYRARYPNSELFIRLFTLTVQ